MANKTLLTEWEVRDVSMSTVFFTHRFKDDSVPLRMLVLETKLKVMLMPENAVVSLVKQA